MNSLANELQLVWETRLLREYPQQTPENRQSIVRWLLGENLVALDNLTPHEVTLLKQKMDCRYRILTKRYLNVDPIQGYFRLINRLGALMMRCPQVRTWIIANRDHQKSVLELLQRIIQEISTEDLEIQQQISWIAQCTQDTELRDILLLASLEEYCLQPIGSRPLLVHRSISFLRHQLQSDRIEKSERASQVTARQFVIINS
jgi:hypothetical protein